MKFNFLKINVVTASLFLILLAGIVPFNTQAETNNKRALVFVYSEQYPPLSWLENNTDNGIYIDLVKEIFEKRLNIPVIFKGLPWARAQYEVQNGLADAFITTTNAERQQYSDVGKESVVIIKNCLYSSKDHPKIHMFESAKSLNDLKKYKFIGNRGNKWQEENLQNMELVFINSRENLLESLILMRADLWVEMDIVADYTIRKYTKKNTIVKLKTSLVFPDTTTYLHISKNSKFNNLISEFDKTLTAMKKDGTYKKILRKYGVHYL